MKEQACCIPVSSSEDSSIDSIMSSLSQKAKTGSDGEADQALFGQHVYLALERIVDKLCRPWVPQMDERLEDLRQSCMLKIFKNIKTYDGTKKFSTWVWIICRNELIERERYCARRRPQLSSATDFDATFLVASPKDQSMLRLDIARCIRELATEYPQKKKFVFELLGDPDCSSYHVPSTLVITEAAKASGLEYHDAYMFYKHKVVPYFKEQFA